MDATTNTLAPAGAPSTDLADVLRSTCIKIRVSSSALGMTRTDKRASERTVQDHNASEGAARVVVSRLPGADEHHRELARVQNGARMLVASRTMPYGAEDGWRLLPNVNAEKLLGELTAVRRDFDAAHARLIANADDILATARANMGSFDVPLPTRDELVDAYALDWTTETIPDDSGYTNLPPATAALLRQRQRRQLAAAVENATTDTLRRFVPPLEQFVAKMEAYNERAQRITAGGDGGRRGAFNDTVLDAIKGLFSMLGAFNIAGDERLAQLGARIAAFDRMTPDHLRNNAQIRAGATARARAVLNELNGWLKPQAGPAQDQAA